MAAADASQGGSDKITTMAEKSVSSNEVVAAEGGDAKGESHRRRPSEWKSKLAGILVRLQMLAMATAEAAEERRAAAAAGGAVRKRRTGLPTVSVRSRASSSPSAGDDHINNNSVPAGRDENVNEAPTLEVNGHRLSMDWSGILKRSSDDGEHHIDNKEGRQRRVSFCQFQDVRLYNTSTRPGHAKRRLSMPESSIITVQCPKESDEENLDEEENLPHPHGIVKEVGEVEEEEEVDEEEEEEDNDEEEEEEDKDEEGPSASNDECNSSLLPTFVSPRRRPGFADAFRKAVVLLEKIDVTDDLCIRGLVRVNMEMLRATRTKEQKQRTQRISVGITFTKDNWETREEAMAMLVQGPRLPPSIEDIESACFRFALDCADMNLGDRLSFLVWCRDRDTCEAVGEDDDGRRFYSVACCARLTGNPWAEAAAKRLAQEAAPVVRFNRCLGGRL